MEQSESFLRLHEVERRCGLKKSFIYRMVEAGQFPRPIALTPKTRAWVSSEVDRWIQDRIRTSRGLGEAA